MMSDGKKNHEMLTIKLRRVKMSGSILSIFQSDKKQTHSMKKIKYYSNSQAIMFRFVLIFIIYEITINIYDH